MYTGSIKHLADKPESTTR